MAPAMAAAVEKRDTVLRKGCYSAFRGTALLRLLRARMVQEVFICGSLANVGVYATALDAAGHGLSITVVEDCCGFRSEARLVEAVRSLMELTGCEIASSNEVLELIRPKTKPAPTKPAPTNPAPGAAHLAAAPSDSKTPRQRASESPDIARPMTGLRLTSNSPSSSPSPSTSTATATLPSPSPAADPNTTGTTAPAHEGDSQHAQQNASAVAPPPPRAPNRDPEERSGAAEIASPATNTSDTTTVQPARAETARMATLEDTKLAPASDSDDEHTPGAQRGLCEGDTDIIENVLPPSLEAGIFDTLRREVQWQRMSHQGGDVPRLVAVQGAVGEHGDSIPVYRHPSDEAPPLLPFSPSVLAIKEATEAHLGHPLNHVLIQFYRDGSDYISEHSDKTLDIVPGSFIANVSLGAERTMVLRTKRADKDPSRTAADMEPAAPKTTGDDPLKRRVQRARLNHNSLCRMGLRTNMKWLHAIRQDKRLPRDKTPAELAFGGGRISLTFRHIGTFLAARETLIWGQGATGKTRAAARPVVNGQGPEAVRMLRAFGTENHAAAFDWAAHYGAGFDVLHISLAPRFFASADGVVNMRVALMLAEYGVGYARGSMAPVRTGKPEDEEQQQPVAVKFVDNDPARSTVHGDVAVMLYIDACYGQGKPSSSPPSQPSLAGRFTNFQRALHLLDTFRQHTTGKPKGDSKSSLPKPLKQELNAWDATLAPSDSFLGGPAPSLPDFALWPVLHAIGDACGPDVVFDGLDNLRRYYEAFAASESARKVLGTTEAPDKS
ncbi:Uncharacterized protein TCAP_01191 [Tolypocladium capitatum]|uniref:Fe2OG dioxygenase domain-containing protein n=1 Tax=Tolypocladium capitatum TaxID=45235 RepID=A0A2K3QMY5_9HYPO|nr:Uncharacterized protein TCAP_01191 [Tolypocladium capitatum]